MLRAAIDIGTVTTRLLIADVDEESRLIRSEILRRVEITNLGIGVDAQGYLQNDAIDRVVACVHVYRVLCEITARDYQQEITLSAVATSAARDAANRDVLVERLRDCGVELAVIPGKQEATLSFRGASLNYLEQKIMVVDVGGGSTEVIIGIGGSRLQFSHSFNVGCRRVTERFIRNDPPLLEELTAAQMYVRESMEEVIKDALKRYGPIDRIVAVAGTATSVISIDKHMSVYDPSQVDGAVASLETIDRIRQRLASLSLAERQEVVGLEPKRASVIVAGMTILQEVVSLARSHSFTVSESDILQGLLLN